MGHLNRASLIYNYLSSRYGYNVNLVMKKDPQALTFIKNNIFPFYFHESSTVEKRNNALSQLIDKMRPKLLIIDILDMDSIQPCIDFAKNQKCKVVVIIDNTNRKEINADIILNGNPNQLGQDYSNQEGRYLIGPEYFIMDSVYSNTKVRAPSGNVMNILISLGGSDHNDLLFRIIKVMGKIRPDISLLLVSSMATDYIKRLKKFLVTQPNPCQLLLDVPGLANLWQQCDMAITAGGNTLFERISVQCPGATVCQLERQMEIADKFEDLGVNFNIGFGPALSDDVLEKKMNSFITNTNEHIKQYNQSHNIVDGKGLIHFGNEIKKIFGEL